MEQTVKTPPTYANSTQVGGRHYQKHGDFQHWDMVDHFNLDYFQGQITKYVMRWKDKNGIQDLEKAQHFLQKYIELTRAHGVQRGLPDNILRDTALLKRLSKLQNDGAEPTRNYVGQAED